MKTADEMFREQGYMRTESDSVYPLYQDKNGIAIEIAVKADCIAKYRREPWEPGTLPMTLGEFLAIGRLIEEMEAEA